MSIIAKTSFMSAGACGLMALMGSEKETFFLGAAASAIIGQASYERKKTYLLESEIASSDADETRRATEERVVDYLDAIAAGHERAPWHVEELYRIMNTYSLATLTEDRITNAVARHHRAKREYSESEEDVDSFELSVYDLREERDKIASELGPW